MINLGLVTNILPNDLNIAVFYFIDNDDIYTSKTKYEVVKNKLTELGILIWMEGRWYEYR